MRVLGLITEYNPFHNGHLYHLEESKKITNSDFTVVVMSGNYVQRGEPAIVDKWTRTKMALEAGADLVLELPVVYATSSAEFFAFGAISILHHSNITDCISFGSELGSIDLLSQIADFLFFESDHYKMKLKAYVSKGLAFPLARNKALISEFIDKKINIPKEELNKILSSSNNILAIEYLKALKLLKSPIEVFTIKRQGASYNSTQLDSIFASATGIRNSLKNNDYSILYKTMPKKCADLFLESINLGKAPVYYNDFSFELQYLLKTMPPETISKIMEIDEGLENRIIKSGMNHFYINDLTKSIKTKRYTLTKIQRALLNMLLQIYSKDFWDFHNNGGPQYIRILGFRKTASPLLKKLKLNSNLPIISNIKKSYVNLQGLPKKMLEKEIYATDIYSLHYPKVSQRIGGLEFSSPLIIINK
ncbi:MAG: nucleotidyltransferase [Epulopiscium sp.]|mgnify:CR=1 FL=1|nr:nucleotidyltransferase [Candidatus Epulonipiscium sp.]